MIEMQLSELAGILGTSYQGRDIRFCGLSIDSRTLKSGSLFVALKGDRTDGHDYLREVQSVGATAVMLERNCMHNIDLPFIVTPDNKKAMYNLAKSWRNRHLIPHVAITGSNGKTSVKEMLSTLLSNIGEVCMTQGNLNNALGIPLTLFQLESKQLFAVIEAGANRLGEIAEHSALIRPTVAVITSCSPAHLAGFGSLQDIAKAKGEIFSGVLPGGFAVLNRDSNFFHYWEAQASHLKQISFGIKGNADVSAQNIVFDVEKIQTRCDVLLSDQYAVLTLPVLGEHNIQNALAAIASFHVLMPEITLDTIVSFFKNYHSILHRLSVTHLSDQITLIDDSYNANPGSLQAGLQVLQNYKKPTWEERWLVLGDMVELGDAGNALHHKAGLDAKCFNVNRLYSVGDLAAVAAEKFEEGGYAFSNTTELSKALHSDIANASKRIVILIKGSRSMQMESVVDSLRRL